MKIDIEAWIFQAHNTLYITGRKPTEAQLHDQDELHEAMHWMGDLAAFQAVHDHFNDGSAPRKPKKISFTLTLNHETS